MSDLHIGTSPLTGTIFCGKMLKSGTAWGADKKDKTIEALIAVAEHALHFKKQHGNDVIISLPDGTPVYKISVERLDV